MILLYVYIKLSCVKCENSPSLQMRFNEFAKTGLHFITASDVTWETNYGEQSVQLLAGANSTVKATTSKSCNSRSGCGYFQYINLFCNQL